MPEHDARDLGSLLLIVPRERISSSAPSDFNLYLAFYLIFIVRGSKKRITYGYTMGAVTPAISPMGIWQ